ncbi:MAG: ATP-binding protein [Opitutaceae bacterium]|jgi:two-component system phosphate regulon sensor histidine kinase PhoR
MLYLIIAALGLGLALAIKKLRDHGRAVCSLRRAILEKQPLLREGEASGTAANDWDRLRSATNELITEVAHLQRLRSGQLAQLETTLGSLQEAVLIVDTDNRILLANQALQAIFPRAKDILNQRLEIVLHSVAFLNYVAAVRAGRADPQHELEFIEGDSSLWLEVTGALVTPLNGEGGSWALFVLHDITKQKELEGIRKDFVANVSHELRTPLSIIKGYIETLVDGHRNMPIEDRARFLQTIQRHTERLNSLLEDLLTLSRLESINPGLHCESTRFADLITSLIDDIRGRTTTGGHLITCAFDPAIGSVLIDPLKISQVCANLLDNALKYTPPGSRIDVSARLHEGEVEVCVRDNGPGIPEADLSHVFERFYRVDKGRSRDKGGTGLGLSIVKHIVQLHGGRVWVESELGKGTAFYFTLPQRAI